MRKSHVIIISITLISIAVLALNRKISGFGYYVTSDDKALAEYLVNKGRDISECNKLIHFEPFAPSPWEKRLDCKIHYARISKNPAVCEGLMPSSFGWRCLGAAMGNAVCSLNMNGTVGGNGIYIPLQECSTGTEDIKNNECCIVAIRAEIKTENDCSPLRERQAFYEECKYRVAFKNEDLQQCEDISNPIIKSGCQVGVRALIQIK